MAKFATTHPLDEFFNTAPTSGNGVTVKSIEGRAIVQVFAVNGKTTAVERALKIKETPGQSTITKDYTAIPLSPGQWMVCPARVCVK